MIFLLSFSIAKYNLFAINSRTIVWCRFLKHRFCKTYFNAVWLAQIYTSQLYYSYSVFNNQRRGESTNLPPIKLHWNNSYKTYIIKIDIIIYHFRYCNSVHRGLFGLWIHHKGKLLTPMSLFLRMLIVICLTKKTSLQILIVLSTNANI